MAALLNSIMSSLLLVSCSTAFFDVATASQIMSMFDTGTGTGDLVGLAAALSCFGFLALAIIFNNHLRLPSASCEPDITTKNSEEYYVGMKRQCRMIGIISWVTAVVNIGTIVCSGYTYGQLYSWGEKLASYPGHDFYLGNILHMGCTQYFKNIIILDAPTTIWPSESTEMNNRKIFSLFSAISILASWLGSFVTHHLYFEKNSLEMKFVYEKEEKGEKKVGNNCNKIIIQ